MERLSGRLCWDLPDEITKCDWENIVCMPFHIADLYKVNEYNEAAFDGIREGDSLDADELLRRREGVKAWYFFVRLLDILSKNAIDDAQPAEPQVQDEGNLPAVRGRKCW